METKPPDAFLSYTRFNDRDGRISVFRGLLEDAVKDVTGEPFKIFQDVDGIGIGEHWPDKLDQMLDEARFFIPIVTQGYFTSRACREELERFLRAEAARGRNDLVLPIYYIESRILEEPNLRAADPLAAEIYKRQRHDWRRLRFSSSFNTKAVRTALHKIALEIDRARRRPMREVTAPQTSAEPQDSDSPPAAIVVPLGADASGPSTEVEYNGTRFVSPVEARWAVFFHTIGLKYEYKTTECQMDDNSMYTPDFWLPELRFWLEVKLDEPTDEDQEFGQRLADCSGYNVLMAIGAPEPRDHLLAFSPWNTAGELAFPRQDEVRFYFADDRRNEGEFWLLSDAGAAASIGPQTGPDHGKDPGLYGATARGYEASRKARFERAETSQAHPAEVSPSDSDAEQLLSQPIDKATLEIYTKWKYPDLPVDEKVQRLLLRDLDRGRYKTLGDLDRVVDQTREAVDRYEVERPEWFKAGTDHLTKSLGFGDADFRERHPFAQQTREAFSRYAHLVKSETSEPLFEPPFRIMVDGKLTRVDVPARAGSPAIHASIIARRYPGSRVQVFDQNGRVVAESGRYPREAHPEDPPTGRS